MSDPQVVYLLMRYDQFMGAVFGVFATESAAKAYAQRLADKAWKESRELVWTEDEIVANAWRSADIDSGTWGVYQESVKQEPSEDPILFAFESAPVATEPITAEEEEAVNEARQEIARGEGVSADEARRQLFGDSDIAPVRSYISLRPGVVGGAPCIRDTRLSVDFMVGGLLNAGEAWMLDNYPDLTRGDLIVACWYVARYQRRTAQGRALKKWAEEYSYPLWQHDYDGVPLPGPETTIQWEDS